MSYLHSNHPASSLPVYPALLGDSSTDSCPPVLLLQSGSRPIIIPNHPWRLTDSVPQLPGPFMVNLVMYISAILRWTLICEALRHRHVLYESVKYSSQLFINLLVFAVIASGKHLHSVTVFFPCGQSHRWK